MDSQRRSVRIKESKEQVAKRLENSKKVTWEDSNAKHQDNTKGLAQESHIKPETSSRKPVPIAEMVQQEVAKMAEKEKISEQEAAKLILEELAEKKGLSIEELKKSIQDYRRENPKKVRNS